jgi:hypothetical protein
VLLAYAEFVQPNMTGVVTVSDFASSRPAPRSVSMRRFAAVMCSLNTLNDDLCFVTLSPTTRPGNFAKRPKPSGVHGSVAQDETRLGVNPMKPAAWHRAGDLVSRTASHVQAAVLQEAEDGGRYRIRILGRRSFTT